MWNITGFAFYAAGTSQTAGTPSRLNVLWSSNTVQLSDAREAINVSDVRLAHVWIANNVFTGSYAVAYLGCATCREFDNDWYGGASYVPDGPGDLYSPPELSIIRFSSTVIRGNSAPCFPRPARLNLVIAFPYPFRHRLE